MISDRSGNFALDYTGRVEYKDNFGFGISVYNSATPAFYISSATGYVGIGTGYGGATSHLMVNLILLVEVIDVDIRQTNA